MSFTFVDVEASRSRRIALLFSTLVIFYFFGALLLYAAVTMDSGFGLHRHGGAVPAASRGAAGTLQALPWVFGFALLAALAHWVLSVRRMIPRILDVVDGRPLDPEDRHHRVLANIMAEISAATGGRSFEAVTVNSRNLNAFALSDLGGHSVIGVTEALLVRLDRRQLEAVIAHEASHVLWGDCLTTTVSCSMAAVWAGLLRLSMPNRESGAGAGVTSVPARALPVLAVILFMRGLTLLLNIWLSRQREHRADATAVRLTRDPLALAGALQVITGGGRTGLPLAGDLAPIFIVSPVAVRGPNDSAAAGLFSTHPPPCERIAQLLTLAHADERALLAGLGHPPTPEAETPLTRPGDARKWFALEGLAWRGPFGAVELAALPWATLQTPVADAPGGAALPAWEHPEINVLLRRKRAGDAPTGGCPRCAGRLQDLTYEGVPLRKCESCRGRLVGRARFARILAREEQPASPDVLALARELVATAKRGPVLLEALEPGQLRCPDCGLEMKRKAYYALLPYRVEIDRCESCGVLWLDGRELELIEHFMSLGRG